MATKAERVTIVVCGSSGQREGLLSPFPVPCRRSSRVTPDERPGQRPGGDAAADALRRDVAWEIPQPALRPPLR
jgi:hypothetical protein